MPTDILIKTDDDDQYDISLDDDGDIASGDFFDTSMLYSILGERRALPPEVPKSSRRRGWLGNEFEDYENGSKIWLYEQSKLTRTILNNIESEAENSLQWMIDDNFAVGNIITSAVVNKFETGLKIDIKRPSSEVDRRYFVLWNNTGISSDAT